MMHLLATLVASTILTLPLGAPAAPSGSAVPTDHSAPTGTSMTTLGFFDSVCRVWPELCPR